MTEIKKRQNEYRDDAFHFRLIKTKKGDVLDTSKVTPYNSLSWKEMEDYMAVEESLNFLAFQARKAARKKKEKDEETSHLLYKLKRKIFG